jgi:hypothetical protein
VAAHDPQWRQPISLKRCLASATPDGTGGGNPDPAFGFDVGYALAAVSGGSVPVAVSRRGGPERPVYSTRPTLRPVLADGRCMLIPALDGISRLRQQSTQSGQ